MFWQNIFTPDVLPAATLTIYPGLGPTSRNTGMCLDEGGQAEVVWTCHEERPKVCRKKDDGNGVTGKEEKRETKEKISRCSERKYGRK